MHAHGKWLFTAVLVSATGLAAPSLQTGTRITLNVIAFDSHDQIVNDLTSQDFQVSDQGKAQSIASFRRTPESQAKSPVVILFDLLNTNLGNQGYGTEELIQTLPHIESGESLYLYLLTNQALLSSVHALPGPHEQNPVEQVPWTEHIQPLLEASIGNVYGSRLGNSPGTLPAIETLGTALRPFPGRKTILWITRGVPIPSGGKSLNQLATNLDKEGVTLSSVNEAIGVDSGDPGALDKLAQLTGGRVYFHDMKKAVEQVMSASRSGYVIEYDAPRPDGKYHKIRVTCSRKGVRLQAKQGYDSN